MNSRCKFKTHAISLVISDIIRHIDNNLFISLPSREEVSGREGTGGEGMGQDGRGGDSLPLSYNLVVIHEFRWSTISIRVCSYACIFTFKLIN